jgi:hypothetical protein
LQATEKTASRDSDDEVPESSYGESAEGKPVGNLAFPPIQYRGRRACYQGGCEIDAHGDLDDASFQRGRGRD